MPADRKKSYKQVHAGPSKAKSEAEASTTGTAAPAHKIRPTEQRSSTGIPGVNKIKGQIRQTKRLLAKDDLEPGLRVSTERRLASLEADLANASKREVERTNGSKYHMVKFFERQKLLRLVKRAKKTIANEEKSEKKRSRAEQDLTDARIMLNYILHYPNTQKYIALFPATSTSSSKSKSTPAEEEEEEGKLILPPLLHLSEEDQSKLDKPSQRRLELLNETKSMMDQGKFSTTPEDDVRKSENEGGHELGGTTKDVGLIKGSTKGKKEDKDDFFEEDD